MSASDRRAKLERAHPDLSIRRQCAMLGLARSGVYRKPRPANDNDLEAMGRIDALFTARPLFGARRIARTLTEDGFPIDRKRVRRLMRRMGIEALGPKPRTSKPAPGHKIYPYLLRGLFDRATEPSLGGRHNVHSASARLSLSGRRHRLASRAVLAWRLSNTMDASCLTWRRSRRRWPSMARLRQAQPEIFNTDRQRITASFRAA